MGRRHKPHLRCDACRMHRSLCICALLPRLTTRTRVLLVLHQLEAAKPTNTGLVAVRCLTNSAVAYRGRVPEGAAAELLEAALSRDDVQPVLFAPHPSATPLDAWPTDMRLDKPLLLVVPDGTWSQVGRTRRRIEAIAPIPYVSLPAPRLAPAAAPLVAPRPERLRTAPQPDRLATLEAIAVALGILEGPAVGAALSRVYRIMTERTLWTNGRIATDQVTGGIPPGVRSHDPLRLG